MRGGAILIAAALTVGVAYADPVADYQQSSDVLNKHSDGVGYDGSLQGKQALEHLWSAVGDWTAGYLDAHPSATVEQLQTAVANLKIDLSGLRLGSSTWLISYSQGETGTFFILARRGRSYREVWRVDQDSADYLKFPALRGWSVDGAGPCRGVYREEVGDTACGPLFGGLTRLPDDSAGNPRFAVDANYGESAGAAVGSQFTIWIWDGHRAKPLYLKGYVRPLEGMNNKFDGRDIHIEERTEFRTAFVTAPEIGHQVNTTIRIDGDRVTNLGSVPAFPAVDFIDQLLADAIAGKHVDSRIAPNAARQLLLVLKKNHVLKSKEWAPLGELTGSATTPVPGGAIICFSTDALGEFHFTVQSNSGGRFVTAISEKPQPFEHSCGFSGP